ncbi:diacylglycerol/lipid kinase family protein [Cellulomonas phragmiteti]|uniref:Sphingosine kinase n=1 Tax=Cellulomonas phragmiteti TaxID=478780 RepID=A0ABQ4DKI1_9CELL|nr:diacylglycerol kinase family protein [Cellulomonas phragmiteti]GIG39859.1 sphingosine kinase [Cellulomonas phragmiteti]
MSTLGLVVNPVAGTGRGSSVGRRTHRLLQRAGHDVHDLSAPTLAQATERARRGATDGLDALVVVGGDGMVHLGVGVAAGTGLPLGIVAVGTGNDVARAFGLPRGDVDRAVAVLDRALRAGPRRVDAVRAGRPDGTTARWYAGVLSCGLDAAVNARANTLTWPRGHARYLRALLPELAAFRPYGYRVRVDDTAWESTGTLVAVANTPWFGGGLPIAPDADPTDGLLDVVLAGPLTRRGAAGIFPRVYRGRHVADHRVQVLRGRRVLVEAAPDLGPPPPPAFADGEPVGPLPLQVDVVPDALHVLL